MLLLLAGIWQLVSYLEGWSSLGSAFNLAVYFSVTITYTILITRVIVKGHEKDLLQLYPLLPEQQPGDETWMEQLRTYKTNRIPHAGAILAGIGHAMIGAGPLYRLLFLKSRYVLFDIWISILIILMWFFITQASALFIDNLRFFSQLVKKCEVDILYTNKLAPFLRAGIRSTLAFMGAYALFPLLRFDDLTYLLFNPAVLIFIPIVITMILIPVLPLRARIRTIRIKELELVEKAINGQREALDTTRLREEKQQLSIVDLITYKKIIHDIKDLPVSIPIAFRLMLYILLPLLTWVAASLVDKIVVALLQI